MRIYTFDQLIGNQHCISILKTCITQGTLPVISLIMSEADPDVAAYTVLGTAWLKQLKLGSSGLKLTTLNATTAPVKIFLLTSSIFNHHPQQLSL